jgi:hypothetical protein
MKVKIAFDKHFHVSGRGLAKRILSLTGTPHTSRTSNLPED